MPHLRPPAFSPGFTAFIWGLVLGGFILLGLLAIGISKGPALVFGILAGFLIFFYVRLAGADQLRR
jgi:hypothetical protein